MPHFIHDLPAVCIGRMLESGGGDAPQRLIGGVVKMTTKDSLRDAIRQSSVAKTMFHRLCQREGRCKSHSICRSRIIN
ncbi:MAG: hypothetical protein HON04_12730 [Planctomicrobium sp.]|nr:hypothetical protein [Planctomicrobium sp.]